MVLIGEAVLEDDVVHARFCCDLQACRGACCCIEGGRGAPLEDDEVLEIEKAFPAVRPFLPPEHLDRIAATGLWEGRPGDHVTPCINDRACVFVYYDDGIARCGFERAYLDGLTDWRKPLSCHLFPIRIRRGTVDHVRYEQIHECAGGRARGEREQVPLADFLKDPLVRMYGAEWYERLVVIRRASAAEPHPGPGS
jgi:hypothetical protein